MNERLIRTGLLLPAAAAWLLALLATAFPAAAPLGACAAGAAGLALTLAARRRPTRRLVLLAAGALVCAVLLVAVAAADARRHPPGLPLGERISADVRIDDVIATAGNGPSGSLMPRQALRGTLLGVDGARGQDVPVTLFRTGGGSIAPGTVVRLQTTLRPGGPTDRSALLGSVTGPLRTVEAPPPQQRAAAGLRAGLLAVTAHLPGDGGDLLPGLAVGDTSRVAPDLQQAMRDASLTHLTAVSGANCAVVIVAMLALGAVARLPRAVRVVLAGAALAGFVVLVTPQPSVVRAGLMAAIGLACVLRGGRTAGVPALALTVIVLLVADPWYAWTAGFVLSVAATGGLLLLAPPLAERLSRVLPARLALLLAVPIAAQIVCQPVLVLLQPGIPVFGVLANLLAEPAAPVATVLGVVACLLAPVVPSVAAGVAVIAWVPAAWIGLVARVVAGLPQLGWPAGLAGAALAAVLVVAGIVAFARAAPRRARTVGAVVVVAGLVVIVGVAAGAAVGRIAGTPRDWTFAACDVGQGDGLVLRGGDGRYAVVDTGREPGPIRACLDRLGVGRIDLLVLTHWDADHVGAARSIAGRVRTAFVGPVDGPAATALRQDLARAGAVVHQVHRGESTTLGRLRFDVLWPPDPIGALQPGNPSSILLHVTGGGASILLTGDLGEDAQDAILAAGPLPRVDVLKVAHHGSADESPAFAAAAAPALSVISVGAGNDYGHPTRRLLATLRALGTAVVRTDQDGLILVSWRDGRPQVWTEHPVTAAVWTPAK